MLQKQDIDNLVSIIVPLYNVEHYIERTLMSINKQVYHNIEVILIDDGSTDKSYEVAEKYLSNSNYKHILVRQENSGVSAARNKGLSIATGKYIVFVDSDDVLSPYYVKQMYDHFKKNNITMVICGFRTFKIDSAIQYSPHIIKGNNLLSSLSVMREFLYGTMKISICSIMVERDFIQKYQIKFAEGYKYSEDIHFVWRLLAHAEEILYDQTPLYYYRNRDGSAMAKFNEDRFDGMFLMQELETYFQKFCSRFADEFSQYGVARWVWATMWQAAYALSYCQFKNYCLKMRSSEMLRKLSRFPSPRVRASSQLFLISNIAYYFLSRIAVRINNVNRF